MRLDGGNNRGVPMDKEVKLIKKVKRLLKRLGCPRWLHHFGPKTYELYHHLAALLARHYCKGLSYRRVVKLLDLFGVVCPSKSALQYMAKRIPKWIWDKALQMTSGLRHYIIAIDGTGFSRTNPSYYYLRRIDGKMPKKYVKLTGALDTRTKKWCAASIRALPAHDLKDTKYLVDKANPNILVMDKAGDANWVHKYCRENGIEAHIPLRDYGKPRRGNMSYRMKAAKKFRRRTYHRREVIESGIGGIKRKSGTSVSSKCVKTIRADIYCMLINHNLFGSNLEF